MVLFYLLGFFLVALLLLPRAGRLTTGTSPSDMAAHPTPLFALVQGVGLLLAFGAATWIVGVKAMHLTPEDLRWRTRLQRDRAFVEDRDSGSQA